MAPKPCMDEGLAQCASSPWREWWYVRRHGQWLVQTSKSMRLIPYKHSISMSMDVPWGLEVAGYGMVCCCRLARSCTHMSSDHAADTGSKLSSVKHNAQVNQRASCSQHAL